MFEAPLTLKQTAELLMNEARTTYANNLEELDKHYSSYMAQLEKQHPGFSVDEYSQALSDGLEATR